MKLNLQENIEINLKKAIQFKEILLFLNLNYDRYVDARSFNIIIFYHKRLPVYIHCTCIKFLKIEK